MNECYIHGNNIKYLRLPEEIIVQVSEEQQKDRNMGGRGGRHAGRIMSGGGRGFNGRGEGRGHSEGGRSGGRGDTGGRSNHSGGGRGGGGRGGDNGGRSHYGNSTNSSGRGSGRNSNESSGGRKFNK